MSKIKECFTSRWGKDGRILEADFQQLEVIALAVLSGDPVLRDDVINKDMHCISASLIHNKPYDFIKNLVDKGDPYWTEERRKAKVPTFRLQYGAGVNEIAESFDGNVVKAKEFINNYYDRYQRVQEWQDEVAEEVKLSRVPSKFRTEKGLPAGVGRYHSITGRIYTFKEYDNPYYDPAKSCWSKQQRTNFSPTQMKNYPVQGFATGDIVPEVLGRLFRELTKEIYDSKILMINTVHDSVVYDVHLDMIHSAKCTVKDIMERAPKYMKERFNIDIDIPMKVDVKVGKSWGNVHE